MLEGHAEVVDAAHGLTRASGEEVRDGTTRVGAVAREEDDAWGDEREDGRGTESRPLIRSGALEGARPGARLGGEAGDEGGKVVRPVVPFAPDDE